MGGRGEDIQGQTKQKPFASSPVLTSGSKCSTLAETSTRVHAQVNTQHKDWRCSCFTCVFLNQKYLLLVGGGGGGGKVGRALNGHLKNRKTNKTSLFFKQNKKTHLSVSFRISLIRNSGCLTKHQVG